MSFFTTNDCCLNPQSSKIRNLFFSYPILIRITYNLISATRIILDRRDKTCIKIFIQSLLHQDIRVQIEATFCIKGIGSDIISGKSPLAIIISIFHPFYTMNIKSLLIPFFELIIRH